MHFSSPSSAIPPKEYSPGAHLWQLSASESNPGEQYRTFLHCVLSSGPVYSPRGWLLPLFKEAHGEHVPSLTNLPMSGRFCQIATPCDENPPSEYSPSWQGEQSSVSESYFFLHLRAIAQVGSTSLDTYPPWAGSMTGQAWQVVPLDHSPGRQGKQLREIVPPSLAEKMVTVSAPLKPGLHTRAFAHVGSVPNVEYTPLPPGKSGPSNKPPIIAGHRSHGVLPPKDQNPVSHALQVESVPSYPGLQLRTDLQ
eukprot:599989-Rhodomonas_salina.1